MVQWPGARILRRQELDAFLAQALSPKLYEPDQLQELKVRVSLSPWRGGPGDTAGRTGQHAAGVSLGAFPLVEMVESALVR